MAQATQFRCDGCDLVAVVSQATTPPDWKEVRLEWSGLEGYPTCMRAGAQTSDLCPQCSAHLVKQMKPHLWPRAAAHSPTPAPKED